MNGDATVNLYTYLVVYTVSLGGFCFGYEISTIGYDVSFLCINLLGISTQPKQLFRQVLNLDSFAIAMGYRFFDEASGMALSCSASQFDASCSFFEKDASGWITFFFLVGGMIGAFIVALLADWIGRRRSILVGSIVFIVGVTLHVFSPGIEVFYVGRVVSGIGVGILSMVVPLYLSEIAPSNVRGKLTSTYQLAVTAGIFLGAVVSSVIVLSMGKMNDITWRICLAIHAIPGVLLAGSVAFIPASPRFLVLCDHDSDAKLVLRRLRGKSMASHELDLEFKEMKTAIEKERKEHGVSKFIDLIRPGIRPRLFIGVLLQQFRQYTAINGILYYQNVLYRQLGFGETEQIALSIALNFFNICATIPGLVLIEKVGRRKLLILGGIGIAISHVIVTVFSKLAENVSSGFGYGSVVGFFLFILSFASTWGPTPYVVQAEIFPLYIRSKGNSCSAVSNWVSNAVIGKLQPLMLDAMGSYMFLVYAAFGLIMALYCYLCVPETSGLALEEIDELFSKSHPSEDVVKSLEGNSVTMVELTI